MDFYTLLFKRIKGLITWKEFMQIWRYGFVTEDCQ